MPSLLETQTLSVPFQIIITKTPDLPIGYLSIKAQHKALYNEGEMILKSFLFKPVYFGAEYDT